MKGIGYRYEIVIGAPAAQVWSGLIDGNITRQYVYGTRFESQLKAGAPYAYLADGDFKAVDGNVVDVEPEKRLVITWSAHWDATVDSDRASRVTFELLPAGPSTKLTLVHDDFDAETATFVGSIEAWPTMLSSLKTILETGHPLVTS
jgi:uncharacterized protein YndB with AHSA1/START domain